MTRARWHRLPWTLINLVLSCTIALVMFHGFSHVADEFSASNRRETLRENAITRRDDAKRAAQSLSDTAHSRVASCNQFNGQQQDSVSGTLDTVVRILRVNTPPVLAAHETARIWQTLGAVYESQLTHHRPRDCSPIGIDRYLGQRLGTQAAALHGHQLPAPKERAP